MTDFKALAGRALHRISLTHKMVFLTAVAGIVIWGGVDYFQTSALRAAFEADLTERLGEQAREDRFRFDTYISSYDETAALLAGRTEFTDYLKGRGRFPASEISRYYETPPWLPERSVMRALPYIHYAFLIDGKGRVREIFYGREAEPPASLLQLPEHLLTLSLDQSYMTTVEDRPYLLTSKEAMGAVLMLAVEIDEDFLIASKLAIADRLVALVESEKPNRIVASNRPDLFPAGIELESLKGSYLVTGKAFFDYGSSDLLIGYTSLVSIEKVKALQAEVMARERKGFAAVGALLIASFAAIMFWIARRINRLTGRVSEFSEKALGGAPPPRELGDQIDILDERFESLTKEVVLSSESLRRARDELERRVKERTEELRKSEERFRLLFNQASDAIILLDPSPPEGPVIVDANAATCEMHGYGREEIIGMPIAKLDDPESARHIPERVRRMMSGEMLTFEVGHLRKDGTSFPVEVSSRRVSIGGKDYIQAIDRDITERKRAERELTGLYNTLDTVFDHMPSGMALLDVEDRLSLVNPIGAEYLKALAGVRAGDVLSHIGGRPVREFLVSPPLIKWHEVAAGARTFEAAGRVIDNQGMVFVLRDVTEERAVKHRIQMHERLASIGQLASGVAHDFNNILTVINGYAEMLLDLDLPEDAKKQVRTIQQSGQRAAELITQILDFSRKTVVEMRPVDLISFVNQFIGFIRRAIPENIHISFDYALGRYAVKADPTKLQQVLANLAVNARDAMPEGGELRLSLSRMHTDEKPPLPGMTEGDWVTIAVQDTGSGIGEDVLPHIFEPFYTTKAGGRGAGLGLSQVYGIVKQHGGYIDVKTKVGAGSVFTIYMPAVTEAVEPSAPVEAPAAIPAGKGETLLVVEDEKPVLEFIRRVLKGLGYKLYTAANGLEALKVYDKHAGEIELVLTDLVMPEMGGVELLYELRQRSPALKVIALSGYPMAEEKDISNAGFAEFIKKPFQVKTIAEAIRKALPSGKKA